MAERSKLLIVDDEVEIVRLIAELFSEYPFDITQCYNGEDALKLIEATSFNILITDLMMAPVDGLTVLKRAKQLHPMCEIIVITGYATMDTSIEALASHVFDYIEKPINLEKLERSVNNANRKSALAVENSGLIKKLSLQNEELERQVEEATRDLQEQTVRDYLTGLNNYRFLVNALTTEISRSVRYGRPMSFCMLDLDFFKHYNDALGHLAGNQALRTVAHIIRSQVRGNDMVARYGGEEFAVILPETTKEETFPIIARIQKALRDRNFSYSLPSGEKALLTVSAGISGCPGDANDMDDLVRKADEALYKAKDMGRDQLVIFGDDK